MNASGLSPYLVAPKKPESVRIANIADAQSLYELLLKLYVDNPLGISMSMDKVSTVVENMCLGNGGIAGVIDGPDGDLIGSVGVVANSPWFSDETHLLQLWLFVDPAHRKGTRHGHSLFEFARWHKDDMSRRTGRHFGLETSFLSIKEQAAKAALWSRHARMVGAIYWVD